MRRPPARTRGFALVETLIAMAILAVLLASLYALIAQDARVARQTLERREAALIARSTLEQALALSQNSGLPEEGQEGDFLWRIEREEQSGEALESGPPVELITVTVTPAEATRPLVQIRSLRLLQ